MRIVTFKAPDDFVELIDAIAKFLRLSRSEVIRDAVWWYIYDQARKKPELARLLEEWRRRRQRRRGAEEKSDKITFEITLD